jgi:predicted metal-dependent hydrolase
MTDPIPARDRQDQQAQVEQQVELLEDRVALQLAVEQFNRGEFYACHDTLEALWMEAVDPERRFYQGLLQTAVAYYHLNNNNRRGCMILLGEANSKLADFLPTYAGWELQSLWQTNQSTLRHLSQLSPEAPLPCLAIPTLSLVEDNSGKL